MNNDRTDGKDENMYWLLVIINLLCAIFGGLGTFLPNVGIMSDIAFIALIVFIVINNIDAIVGWLNTSFGEAIKYLLKVVVIPVVVAVILELTTKNDYNFYHFIPTIGFLIFLFSRNPAFYD